MLGRPNDWTTGAGHVHHVHIVILGKVAHMLLHIDGFFGVNLNRCRSIGFHCRQVLTAADRVHCAIHSTVCVVSVQVGASMVLIVKQEVVLVVVVSMTELEMMVRLLGTALTTLLRLDFRQKYRVLV